MNKNKKMYTITQAAEKLAITRQAMQYAVAKKLIKVVKICGKNYVPASAVRKYKPRKNNKGTPAEIMKKIPKIRDIGFINYLKKIGTEE